MSSLIVVLIAETTSTYFNALDRKYEVHQVRSGKQGLQCLQAHQAQVIIIDAVSLRSSGERICKMLRDHAADPTIIHIHPGPKNEANSAADVVLFMPITGRMLINSIEHLHQQQTPQMLQVGPFQMDAERRIVRAHGNEVTLPPKQAALLETFLQHPNQTLAREWLIQQVWHTDYVGDTRTLSVHIRLVRQAIEPDPGQPCYLKTVRGIGYRLEIENKKPT